MDQEQNILDTMFKICEEEGFDKKTFQLTKDPLSNEIREIQKEHNDIIRVFLTGIPLHSGDDKLCFEKVYRNFLKRIKEKYDGKFWQLEKPQKEIKSQQKKKVS
jgi:hypothetical protein